MYRATHMFVFAKNTSGRASTKLLIEITQLLPFSLKDYLLKHYAAIHIWTSNWAEFLYTLNFNKWMMEERHYWLL
jgi:hypothetical protein